MNIACIIPARGGSKGIPNKNIMPFAGYPLIYWSIAQALETKSINCGVYVSSDSDKILELTKTFGAIPIQRPKKLSSDIATSESALIHAVEKISYQYALDAIVFLQATSPLRLENDIENGIQWFINKKYDSLFSATKIEDFLIWNQSAKGLESFNYDYKNRQRRQDMVPQYVENGSFYIFNPYKLQQYKNRLYGNIGAYIMSSWSVHEIDTPDDLELCEYLFKKNKLNQRSTYDIRT
tara:strand:- start:2205 stop:2915 length:711 start_codon:yes stop_codon:yes gene_type:complete